MPFCHAPWTNLDIDPQGSMAPCCKYQHGGPASNIRDVTVEQYRSGTEIQMIKQDFLAGRWPAGCDRCRIEEANGIASKRIMDGDRWAQAYRAYDIEAQTDLLTASVAFGNTCNLACVTCNPWVSSRWQKEYADATGTDVPPNHFYKDGFIKDFTTAAPNLIHLDIPGGEPFLSGTHQQKSLLASYRDSNQAGDLALHYTTNVTRWPDDDWWDIWQDFREIEIQLSIDAVGARAGYIRYPCEWDDICRHVDRYLDRCASMPNLKLSVSCTVSAYNIYYLDEVISWCYNIGLPQPWMGRVHRPLHMRPTVWPVQARQLIQDRLYSSRHQILDTWADMFDTVDDSNHFDRFRQHVRSQDLYRSTDFRMTFPEMAEFV